MKAERLCTWSRFSLQTAAVCPCRSCINVISLAWPTHPFRFLYNADISPVNWPYRVPPVTLCRTAWSQTGAQAAPGQLPIGWLVSERAPLRRRRLPFVCFPGTRRSKFVVDWNKAKAPLQVTSCCVVGGQHAGNAKTQHRPTDLSRWLSIDTPSA